MTLTNQILHMKLKEEFPKHIYTAWLKDIKIGRILGDDVTLILQEPYKIHWIKMNYMNLIMKIVKTQYPFCKDVILLQPQEFKRDTTSRQLSLGL